MVTACRDRLYLRRTRSTMKKKKNVYLTLISSTFYISLLIIGGGYVAIPMLKKKFVDELKWVEEQEMADLIAIAQCAPGAVIINSSILVGYKVAGVLGSAFTVAGMILPSLIIISIVQLIYSEFISNQYVVALFRGMNAAVAAMMIDVVLSLTKTATKSLNVILTIVITATVFVLVFVFNFNAAYVMLCAIAIFFVFSLVMLRKEKNKL